jgi:hypothetical protein
MYEVRFPASGTAKLIHALSLAQAEVLGKRVVVQHIPLGGVLEYLPTDPAVPPTTSNMNLATIGVPRPDGALRELDATETSRANILLQSRTSTSAEAQVARMPSASLPMVSTPGTMAPWATGSAPWSLSTSTTLSPQAPLSPRPDGHSSNVPQPAHKSGVRPAATFTPNKSNALSSMHPASNSMPPADFGHHDYQAMR